MTARRRSEGSHIVHGSRWMTGVALLALVAAACSNASSAKPAAQPASGSVTTFGGTNFTKNVPVKAPGVSATEIHVGSIVSITNPVGGDYRLMNDGIKAYFDVVNGRGGVWGRKLKLTSERDDQTVNNLNQAVALLAQDNVYAAFVGAQLFSGAPKLAQAGIPTFGWNVNAEWAGPLNFFPNVAPYCFTGCTPLQHLLPWVISQVHAHKIAFLGYNIPASSDAVDAAANAVQQFGDKIGAQVVYKDTSLQFGQTDYSAPIAQMKDKGVDFLFTSVDQNANYSIAKEMRLQGILGKVTVFYPDLYNRDFVQKNADLFEGAILDVPILAVEHAPPPPALQEYLDDAHAHGMKITQMTEQGWAAARQFVAALKAAGPNFTWANLISAWNQQTWFTNDGLVWPIDWTRQHADPSASVANRSHFECGNLVRVHDGAFVGVWDDGGAKPWVCFDGQKPNVWQTPVNVSFAGKQFQLADVQPQSTP